MKNQFRRVFVLTEIMAAVMVAACGGSGEQTQSNAGVLGQTAGGREAAAAVTIDPATGGLDFATRCAQAGVIKCVGFDDVGDFSTGSGGLNGAYGYNAGIVPASGTSDYTRAVRDTSNKASGNSSLKFTIPSNSGADTSGTYFTNFSKDLSVQFDAGQ